MSKKVKYSNEPVQAEVIRDFLPPPDELAAGKSAWPDEVQRRSADLDTGRMKSRPAEKVSRRVRSRLKK